MALADTARLVASLELQDKFSANARKFEQTVGNLDRRTRTLERIGTHIGNGIRNTAQNLVRLGAAGGALLATQVALGVRSLAELEEAQGQTAARIEATGGAANVTAEQVRALSEEIENLSTVDDKAIQAGANMLLTFRNIRNEVGDGNDVFDQATRAVVDLSVAMGSEPEQAALQLGKALNDPIRGLTALRRVGIQFTEEQEEQIRTMVESGRVMDAQKVILRELSQEFGGSAEAFGKSGPGATMRRFSDAVEDGQQALARGFLPLMERVSALAQEAFSNPQVIAGIESFGEGLAGGLDQLIDIAGKLPWSAIGASLQIAGTGAKAVLDAFTSLPPWIQTAVLTGWGLNKLTGGALGGLVGTLTRGLLPGGGLRGATPATPLFTKEVGLGGVGGAAPAAGARGGAGSVVAGAAKFVLGPAAAVLIGHEIGQAVFFDPAVKPAVEFEQSQFDKFIKAAEGDPEKLRAGLKTLEGGITQIAGNTRDFIDQAVFGDQLAVLDEQVAITQRLLAQAEEAQSKSSAFASSTASRWNAEQREAYAQMTATRDVGSKTAALAQHVIAGRQATDRGFSATNAQLGTQSGVLRAIAAKKTSFVANLYTTLAVSVNASLIEERILQQRLSAGTGPQERF